MDEIKKKITLSDALIIAAFPFVAYIVQFVYYYGYFTYFNLPTQFIKFDLQNILKTFLILILFLLLFFVVFINYSFMLKRTMFPSFLSPYLPILLPLLMFSFALLSFLIVNRHSLIFQIIVITLSSIGFVLLVIFLQRVGEKDIPDVILRIIKKINIDFTGSFLDILLKKIYKKVMLAGFYCILLLSFIFIVGYSNALNRVSYLVTNTTPECVVLFITENWAICSPFDRNTKEVESSFTIIYFDKYPGISLSYEEVGRLHLRKDVIYPTPAPKIILQPTLTPTITLTPDIYPMP